MLAPKIISSVFVVIVYWGLEFLSIAYLPLLDKANQTTLNMWAAVIIISASLYFWGILTVITITWLWKNKLSYKS